MKKWAYYKQFVVVMQWTGQSGIKSTHARYVLNSFSILNLKKTDYYIAREEHTRNIL